MTGRIRRTVGFHNDTALDEPVGNTTPEQRHRARVACAERVPADELRDVLEALGLAPYTREETA